MAAVNLHRESSDSSASLGASAPTYAMRGDLTLKNVFWLKSKTDERGKFAIGDLGPMKI